MQMEIAPQNLITVLLNSRREFKKTKEEMGWDWNEFCTVNMQKLYSDNKL